MSSGIGKSSGVAGSKKVPRYKSSGKWTRRIKKKTKKTSKAKALGIRPRKNAYNFFSKDFWATLKKAHPDWTFGQLAAETSKTWKSMSPVDRKKYDDLAKADKDRYDREIAQKQAALAQAGSSSSSSASTPTPKAGSSTSSSASTPRKPLSSIFSDSDTESSDDSDMSDFDINSTGPGAPHRSPPSSPKYSPSTPAYTPSSPAYNPSSPPLSSKSGSSGAAAQPTRSARFLRFQKELNDGRSMVFAALAWYTGLDKRGSRFDWKKILPKVEETYKQLTEDRSSVLEKRDISNLKSSLLRFDKMDFKNKKYIVSRFKTIMNEIEPVWNVPSLDILFEGGKTPFVLLEGKDVFVFRKTVFDRLPQTEDKNMTLFHDGSRWGIKYTRKGIQGVCLHPRKSLPATPPAHLGWEILNVPGLLIRNMGTGVKIPSITEWIDRVAIQCDIQNDLSSSNTPEWVTYPTDIENNIKQAMKQYYIMGSGVTRLQNQKIGSGEYTIDIIGCYQERTNVGANNQSGYKRPIRVVHPMEQQYVPPPQPLWEAFERTYPNFPIVPSSNQNASNFLGLETSSSKGAEPRALLEGLPDVSPQVSSNLIQKFFQWRPDTRYVIQTNHNFVNYYKFADADANLQRMLAMCESEGQRTGTQLKCSILYHATTWQYLADIKALGFQNKGTRTGNMAGMGSYFAIHPYTDYVTGNSKTGMTYIQYDANGYGVFFVCAGAISPSEYTWGVDPRPYKAGSGQALNIGSSSVISTRNENAIVGGTFYKELVESNGTIGRNHREVVYWYDKSQFKCILGVCVVKKI